MRYLITGGSGFLGINLIRYLIQRGETVVSLDLVPFDYADCKDRVEAITGDIRDRATVDRAMERVNLVVHAAAALPLYSEADIVSTDVGGTREIVTAPEAGLIIEQRSADAIACALRTLFADVPDRSSTRRYAERFGWDETSRGQERLFASLRAPQAGPIGEVQP